MRAKRARTFLATVAVVGAMLSAGNPAQAVTVCADASMQGCFTAAFSPFGKYDAAPPKTIDESKEFPAGASVVVLPNGRIVYWNGLQDLEGCGGIGLPMDAGSCAGNSESMVLDLTGSGEPQFFRVDTNEGDDLFCADQRLLADGRVIVAGGTRWENNIDVRQHVPDSPTAGLAELYGSKNTHVFGGSEEWSMASDMAYGRWYPSMLTLSNGNLFIAGGVSKLVWNSSLMDPRGQQPYPQNVLQTETFDVATGTWSYNEKADVTLPLYARLHLLPNGNIFYSGTGQMWGPAGESVDQAQWNFQKIYDPIMGWRNSGIGPFGARNGAFSAMLPLRPDVTGSYNSAQFLLGGGTLGTSPGGEIATPFSELITVSAGISGNWASASVRTADMVNPRWYTSAVVLPNGHVVAVNGADKDEVIMPGIEAPIRQAELWNGEGWAPLATGGRDRTYHNSAILLADGSVLVGGHAPINAYYGANGAENNQANGFANNLKDPSFERLYPPYLFKGNRPVIDSAQADATWGSELAVRLADGSEIPTKFVLSRLPAVTHTTDADQRTVEVRYTRTGNDVKLLIPSNASALPPGYYYLFAMSKSGTPSVAPIVRIAADATGTGTVTPVELIDQM